MTKHGKGGYNSGCRCDVCKTANANLTRRRKHRRRDQREFIDGRWVATQAPEHGSWTIYVNWFCRCKPCCDSAIEPNAATWARYKARQSSPMVGGINHDTTMTTGDGEHSEGNSGTHP
jgi:hypothetical protein